MNDFVLPELKQIIGAMLFVRKEPLTVEEIRRVLTATAERRGASPAISPRPTRRLFARPWMS